MIPLPRLQPVYTQSEKDVRNAAFTEQLFYVILKYKPSFKSEFAYILESLIQTFRFFFDFSSLNTDVRKIMLGTTGTDRHFTSFMSSFIIIMVIPL